MTKRNDLTGQKFGKWTVLEYLGCFNNISKYLCKCDCGTIKSVGAGPLTSGRTSSCGACRTNRSKPPVHIKHGMAGTRLHRIWQDMKARCNTGSISRKSKNYALRGIEVCNEWDEFIPFSEWAFANGYSDELQIDRINNDGNYEPANCRWVKPRDNTNNRRNTRFLLVNGVRKALTDWCREYNMKPTTVVRRLDVEGLTPLEALTRPIRNKRRIASNEN